MNLFRVTRKPTMHLHMVEPGTAFISDHEFGTFMRTTFEKKEYENGDERVIGVVNLETGEFSFWQEKLIVQAVICSLLRET